MKSTIEDWEELKEHLEDEAKGADRYTQPFEEYAAMCQEIIDDRWQPIETAPKDGTPIIVNTGYAEDAWQYVVAHHRSGLWRPCCSSHIVRPTHWRPLPPLIKESVHFKPNKQENKKEN